MSSKAPSPDDVLAAALGEDELTQRSPALERLIQFLALALVVGAIGWIIDIPRTLFDLSLYTEQVLTYGLALSLALVFLSYDYRGRPQLRLVWYDALLGLAGLIAALFLTVRYPVLVYELVFLPMEGVLVASILVLLTIEGVRRAAGTALAIIVSFFIFYGLFGHIFPAPFDSSPTSFDRLVTYLGVDTSAMLGIALQVAVIVIIPFILLGRLLSGVGGSDFFTELAMSLMGRYRGGSGKIAVVGSTLLGSVSGSAVANVAGTGVVTIPLMKRSGFPPHLAGGIEAVASTGSQLMPPVIGATAFLMAEFLQIPYRDVMLAALVPILLYYAALFIQVDLLAARMGLTPLPRSELPRFWPTFRAGWHFLMPFVVFLVLLLRFNKQPEFAALWAVVTLLVLVTVFGYKGRRPRIGDVVRGLVDTGRSSVEIILICAGAGIVIGVLNLTGMAFDMGMAILRFSGENLLLLLGMAAAASVVLGMGMPTVGVYVLLATLVAPAMIEAGVTPMAAHMFVLYFGMLSMVTPPVALAAFAAGHLAQADPWRTSMAAVKLGWTAYIVPFLFVFSPVLLLEQGVSLDFFWILASALLGVWLVSAAIAGQFFGRIGASYRLLLTVAGLMVLVPPNAFEGAVMVEVAGLALAAVAVTWLVIAARRAARRKGESV
ncbi:TRAP transporter 4TM/12TM fusion protein [Natronocella acetinitrilica]|uniref:TRAP transporter 4TM/12TM fusion protein n=1 Tax=Natronocella acetinitrilica TaxID=414046 RepID=A0AAE3KAL3_9GAMM|nr:TRAP transporter fused permease subunit [Natronocella acetinitrilica]MCP1673684.1 TRAP transporter 4TM/12TM fusion protein [Natronocella acetinitrilica]